MAHSRTKTRVAVLRGGPSSNYDQSLSSGASVLRNLLQDSYEAQDIFISKEGIWHKNGVPITPNQAITHADVVFNALHGTYGEDGKVQHILEMHGAPFTGSGSFASALAMNKEFTKNIFKREGIKTPQYRYVDSHEDLSAQKLVDLFRAFPLPFIVKPVSGTASEGLTLVKDFASFEPALHKAFQGDGAALIEEFIPGIDTEILVIDKYRGENTYTSLPARPERFTDSQKSELQSLARKVHGSLGLRHYSQVDFIVTPKRGIYVLEANTLPLLHEDSKIAESLVSVGSNLPEFLDHVIVLAQE